MSITYHLAEWGQNMGHVRIFGRCFNFRLPAIIRSLFKTVFVTTESGRYLPVNGKMHRFHIELA